MSATALLATVLLAQAGAALPVDAQWHERSDVGYEELSQGQPQAAIATIQGNPELASDDPAALINLGSAHARLGRVDQAIEYYRAAIASEERYDLQLADGRWLDSREAARVALGNLMKNSAQALRQ